MMQEKTSMKKHLKIWLYILWYLFVMVFAGYFLPKIGSTFITNNLTFFAHTLVFIPIIFLFPADCVDAVKSLNKSNFSLFFTVGLFTFFFEVIVGICVSLCNIESTNQSMIDSDVLANTFLMNTTIILIAPVTEEIMYRFCIFSVLSSNRFIAYIVSIYLFAFMHVWAYVIIDKDYTQLIVMLPYAAFGTGACVLYDKTDNIAYPIFLHIAMNTIAEIA